MTKQLLDEEIYWILQAIRHFEQTHPLGELVYFDGKKLKRLSLSDQFDLLKVLEEKGIIRLSISKADSKKENSIFKDNVLALPCYIETIEPKYNDICIKSERKWKKKIKNIDNILKDEFDSLSPLEITFKEIEKFIEDNRNREIDKIIEERKQNKKENTIIEEIKSTEVENKKVYFPEFPKDLKWEEISIRFLTEEEVIIDFRKKRYQTTYEMMGFQDRRTKLPKKQWLILRLFSMRKGELSWENNQDLPLKETSQLKKQKQMLSKTLKEYFKIYDDEPFYNYRKEKAYKIKLTLFPEPEEGNNIKKVSKTRNI